MYVDDLLIAGSNAEIIERFKTQLCKRFQLSDCGVLKHFLGMKFEKAGSSLIISQEANITKVLEKFSMIDCNPVKTSM